MRLDDGAVVQVRHVILDTSPDAAAALLQASAVPQSNSIPVKVRHHEVVDLAESGLASHRDDAIGVPVIEARIPGIDEH